MRYFAFGLGIIIGLVLARFGDIYLAVLAWNSAELQAGMSPLFIAWEFFRENTWNLVGTGISFAASAYTVAGAVWKWWSESFRRNNGS